MKRTTLLAAIAVTTAAVGGAALADANHGHGGQADVTQVSGPMQNSGPGMMGMMGGMGGMMDMMRQMHGGMMGGGMMGGMGPMGGSMMQMFDSDGDGTVTAEEMHARLQAQLAEYDSDGDGALSIAEFETLHSAMIREMMVDRFQHLDADGDGSVTSEEMAAPADMMERAQMMRNRMMAAQPEMGADMSDGNMMNDN
ncbi:EF-hand domain-containing protein [Nioella sp.]|uniref:EF-hand domain-containing protein n=1 Tax=Nioella sp. TaxID=1912091 RepID=UPI003A8487FE